jgi:hypothetical protein
MMSMLALAPCFFSNPASPDVAIQPVMQLIAQCLTVYALAGAPEHR